MCKLMPIFQGIWRTYNFFLSVACLIVSGLLGPVVNLAYYIAGPEGDLAMLCNKEPSYCVLLTYIHYLMWLLFSASFLLFFSCWFNSICLVHCSMGLIILNIVLSMALFTRYLIYCSFYDNKCLSGRNNDVNVVSNLFNLNLLYVMFLVTSLFFMGQYKKDLLKRYIGFVSF